MTTEQQPAQTYMDGTVRWQPLNSGHWVTSEPGNPYHTTALMLATQRWDSKTGQWKDIVWD